MAVIKPFKGYRYTLASPEDLGRFVAPPYDMLDSTMVNNLYEKDPCNTVRITQNRPEETDVSNKDRHIRAAKFFDEWIHNGVLSRDTEPSVYIYEQKFETVVGKEKRMVSRTGVVVLVKLVPFEDGVVLPHEYTLSGPKLDRYELLDATRVNTGQIFGLLQDEGDLYSILQSMKQGAPVGVTTDENGVHHTLYTCSDTALIATLVAAAGDRSILIADGHHRYETALNFYRDTGSEEYAYTMMTLVSMADPGLVIKPFHRLIRRIGSVDNLNEELSRYFTIQEIGPADSNTIYSFLGGELDAEMVYVDSAKQRAYKLSLSKDGEQYLNSAPSDHTSEWKHLDVSKINLITVRGIFNLPLDGKVLHDVIEYVNDPIGALQRLTDTDVFHGGFFIKPVQISTIRDIVAGGERMPQKSTNFFPKLYSGLVFNKLDS